MAVGGAAIRFLGVFLYALCMGCGIVILGLYSYFLATLRANDATIPQWEKAVEGISGAGVLYTILAVLLTCFLGGKMFFAFIGIVLDVLFAAGFIAIAVMTRHGASSCTGRFIHSPLGDGPSNSHQGIDDKTFTPTLRTACILNKAAFAVSIIGALLFLISAFVQLWIGRHHQREKRYGPSPANNYTKGNGIRFFKRRKGARSAHAAASKEAEAGMISSGGVATADSVDPRYEHTTGSYVGNKYEHEAAHNGVGHTNGHNAGIPTAGGYHSGPGGSAVNPYGYDNTRPHNTTY